MAEYRLGFIGTGNMGGALASAAAKGVDPSQMVLSDADAEKCGVLAARLNCKAMTNEDVVEKCEYIMLGVKPQMMKTLLASISDMLKARKDRFVLISMAAGLRINQILEMLGDGYPVIRIMPNMPVMTGQGMVLCARGEGVTDAEAEAFSDMFAHAGLIDWTMEDQIDAGCAVTGCGPAFAAMFAEALADGGVRCGLPRAKAIKYAAQMMLGTADMLLKSGMHPGEVKDAVCSPAGSTIEGVRTLENSAFRAACIEAVISAFERTVELGKG